jgi:hypothetical protein
VDPPGTRLWQIYIDVGLSKKYIETLVEAMPMTVKSLPSFCQFVYTVMLLWGFHSDYINKPSCLFGKLRFIMNNTLSNYTYKQFQSERRNVIQEGTDQCNNTRGLFQGAMNKVVTGGSIIITGFEESKPVCFCPMLVTASDSKKGAFQLRDVVLEANDSAVVLETCSLKDTLKSELRRMGYSEDIKKSMIASVVMHGSSNSIAKTSSHQSSS